MSIAASSPGIAIGNSTAYDIASVGVARQLNQPQPTTAPNPLALVHYFYADSALANSTATATDPATIKNYIARNFSGTPMPVSNADNGQIALTAASGANPQYFTNQHTTTSLCPVFNDNFVIWGPNYDVVVLEAFANFQTTDTGVGGLKPTGVINESSSGIGCTVNNESAAATTFTVRAPVDQVRTSTLEASAGICSGDVSQITLLDTVGGSFVAALAATDGLNADYKQRDFQVQWKPFSGAPSGWVAPTAGNPTWIAYRFHKYDPVNFPNTVFISLCSSFYNNGQSVATWAIQFSAPSIGSLMGTGVPVTSPRSGGVKLIAQAIYAYDIANSTMYNNVNWNLDMKAQGDKFAGLNGNSTTVSNTDLTPFSMNAPGVYVNNPDPSMNISSALPTRGQYDASASKFIAFRLIGRVRHGREIMLQGTLLNLAYNSGAKVTLRQPGGAEVMQTIKEWGSGQLGWDGVHNATVNNKYLIRLLVNTVGITNLRGCEFVVYDTSGNIEFVVPLDKATATVV